MDTVDTRIGDLIDCPDWRSEYDRRGAESVVRFVLRKFDDAMTGLGYHSAKPEHQHTVTAHGLGVMQYVLVLYSKHELGQEFWKSALSVSDPQLDLGLPT